MFRRILSVVAIAALCSFASASSIDMSDSASLADLLSGAETLSLGSIEVDNFAATETIDTAAGTVTPIDPANVEVTANLICGSKVQLIFGSAGGAFVASASDGGLYDYLISFDLAGATGGVMSASLTQTGSGTGSAFVNIAESILFTGGGVGLGTDQNFPSDTTTIAGSPTELSLTKDILLNTFPGTTAQISRFTQTYMIPEPSALGLGVFGMIGALGLTRRRRRS